MPAAPDAGADADAAVVYDLVLTATRSDKAAAFSSIRVAEEVFVEGGAEAFDRIGGEMLRRAIAALIVKQVGPPGLAPRPRDVL